MLLKGCDSLITTIISVNKLENFKSIRGATKVKQYNNYQYLTDSFPNYNYLWKVKGGVFVGDSTHAKTWVQWTDSLSGTIMVNANDLDSACFYSNIKVVSVAKPVPSGLGSVSIEEIDLHIVPNPNNGNFSIALKGLSNQTIQLQILDQTGKLVFTQQNIEFEGQLLNINENLPSGAYYIRLITNEAPMIKRFVVR